MTSTQRTPFSRHIAVLVFLPYHELNFRGTLVAYVYNLVVSFGLCETRFNRYASIRPCQYTFHEHVDYLPFVDRWIALRR